MNSHTKCSRFTDHLDPLKLELLAFLPLVGFKCLLNINLCLYLTPVIRKPVVVVLYL